VKLISSFNYDPSSFLEFYNRIMNDLRVSRDRRATLSFHDPNFASRLQEILTEEMKRGFHAEQSFWYDLLRLLFKWTLFMRQKFADNDRDFELSMISVKSIITMIYNNGFMDDQAFISEFLSEAEFNFSIFEDLMKYELFDNPHILEYFIKYVINDLDPNGNGDWSNISYDQIRNKHFHGNFNNNPLLKLIFASLIPWTSENDIKEKYFPGTGGQLDFIATHEFVLAMSRFYLFQNHILKRDIHIIESIDDEEYISSFMVKFFLRNNLGFRISSSSCLVSFLARLDRLGLLSHEGENGGVMSLLERIIKFKIDSEKTWRWDITIFKEYLEREGGEYNVFEEEIESDILLDEYESQSD
jgi:hypothetical protein